MTLRSATAALLTLAATAACGPDQAPVSPELDILSDGVAGLSKASGGGQYLLTLGDADLPGTFSFTALQTDPDGQGKGRLRFTLDLFGEEIDFKGDVTCVTFDLDEGRAWIGGVVTKNDSQAEPYASGEIFQPGRDIWFRVLDSGEGHGAIDRTTFVGFEGGADIITSEEYCDTRLWADGNARTWPVSGNVQVR